MMFNGLERGMEIKGRDGIENGMMLKKKMINQKENRNGNEEGEVNMNFKRIEMMKNEGIERNLRDCLVERVIGLMKWKGFVIEGIKSMKVDKIVKIIDRG